MASSSTEEELNVELSLHEAVRITEAAKKIDCSVDSLLLQASKSERLLYVALKPHSAKLAALPSHENPRQSEYSTKGSSIVALLPHDAESLAIHGSVNISKYQASLNGGPLDWHYWILNEPQTVDLSKVYMPLKEQNKALKPPSIDSQHFLTNSPPSYLKMFLPGKLPTEKVTSYNLADSYQKINFINEAAPELIMDFWDIHTACKMIAIGWNFDIHNGLETAKQEDGLDSPTVSQWEQLTYRVDRLLILARSAVLGGLLKNYDTPANWINWAKSKGISIDHLNPLKHIRDLQQVILETNNEEIKKSCRLIKQGWEEVAKILNLNDGVEMSKNNHTTEAHSINDDWYYQLGCMTVTIRSFLGSEFFNVSWEYWLKLSTWTPKQAALLMCGFDPDKFYEVEEVTRYKAIAEHFIKFERLINDAESTKGLKSPISWLMWFKENGYMDCVPVGVRIFYDDHASQVKQIDDQENIKQSKSYANNPNDIELANNGSKELTKLQKQHNAILAVIRLKNFDSMNIPDGEKGTIQQICEKDYPLIFDGSTSFDRAWDKGLKELFKMANHESYARRGKQ